MLGYLFRSVIAFCFIAWLVFNYSLMTAIFKSSDSLGKKINIAGFWVMVQITSVFALYWVFTGNFLF